MPIGIFIAAYMKIAMKKYGIWFQVRIQRILVSIMLVSILCTYLCVQCVIPTLSNLLSV